MYANHWYAESSGSVCISFFGRMDVWDFCNCKKRVSRRFGRRAFKRGRHAHSLRGKDRRVQRNAQTQRYARRGQKRAQRSQKAVSGDPPQKQLYKIMGRSRDGCDLLVRYPAFPSTPARSHSMLFPP